MPPLRCAGWPTGWAPGYCGVVYWASAYWEVGYEAFVPVPVGYCAFGYGVFA